MAGIEDYRRIFDHYLYDYLKKNNLHETAEIFRIEADLTDSQTALPGVDVAEGFLNEWFQIFHDVHRSRHLMTAQPDEGSSSRRNHACTTHQRDYDLNSQMIDELTVGSNIGMIIDGNLVPAMSASVKKDTYSENSAEAEDDSAALAQLFPEIFKNDKDNLARDEGSEDGEKLEREILNLFYMEEDPNKGTSAPKMNDGVNTDERIPQKIVTDSSTEEEDSVDSAINGEGSKRKKLE